MRGSDHRLGGRFRGIFALVESEADDFTAGVHENVQTAIQVRVELSALICFSSIDIGSPNPAAFGPSQSPWVAENRAESSRVAVEIEFDLPVASGGVGERPDGAVLFLPIVVCGAGSTRFAEQHGGIFQAPLANQLLAINRAVPFKTGRKHRFRGAAENRAAGIVQNAGWGFRLGR